ncbi:MAG: DUF1295 domain-containing protein [Proteobacteria bacterium]|nr:DUF1295 domain-containing protein [Pseudomonadota bacterium]
METTSTVQIDRAKAVRIVCLAYALAGAVALAVGLAMTGEHPIVVAAGADVAATVAVFLFSLTFANSSFYDPYWSVAPIAIALYWALGAAADSADPARQALVIGLVAAWGIRLTYNWQRGWTGLHHEDWRYRDLAEKTGAAYWLVSFTGIHMFPTGIVLLGCLSLYPALADSTRPLGWLDGVAALVTASAIWIEARADKELWRFRHSDPPPSPSDILATGVWSWSRHPNYFGEILFWWGLFLFGVAAAPAWAWTIAGPLAITIMFRGVSLPMIETRMLERRPHYDTHQKRTSMVIPRPPR